MHLTMEDSANYPITQDHHGITHHRVTAQLLVTTPVLISSGVKDSEFTCMEATEILSLNLLICLLSPALSTSCILPHSPDRLGLPLAQVDQECRNLDFPAKINDDVCLSVMLGELFFSATLCMTETQLGLNPVLVLPPSLSLWLPHGPSPLLTTLLATSERCYCGETTFTRMLFGEPRMCLSFPIPVLEILAAILPLPCTSCGGMLTW